MSTHENLLGNATCIEASYTLTRENFQRTVGRHADDKRRPFIGRLMPAAVDLARISEPREIRGSEKRSS